jgi:hypothetical protein
MSRVKVDDKMITCGEWVVFYSDYPCMTGLTLDNKLSRELENPDNRPAVIVTYRGDYDYLVDGDRCHSFCDIAGQRAVEQNADDMDKDDRDCYNEDLMITEVSHPDEWEDAQRAAAKFLELIGVGKINYHQLL